MVAVTVVVVAKMLVCAAAIVARVVVVEADVSSDRAVDLFVEAFTDVMLGVLLGIGIEVLSDTNEIFSMLTPVEAFSRCPAFDCRPLALLDCACDLQTWMPSYHA